MRHTFTEELIFLNVAICSRLSYNAMKAEKFGGLRNMKTQEELEQIKEEYKNLNKKLAELTEDELLQVVGGGPYGIREENSEESHRSFWPFCDGNLGDNSH